MTTEPSTLTVPEIAADLQIAESTVFELLASGELIGMRIGRSRRIRREDYEAFKKCRADREKNRLLFPNGNQRSKHADRLANVVRLEVARQIHEQQPKNLSHDPAA